MRNKLIFGAVTVSLSGFFLGGVFVGVNYNEKIKFITQKITSILQKTENNQSNNNSLLTETTPEKKLLEFALLLTKEHQEYAILSTNNSTMITSRIIQPYSVEFDERVNKPIIYFNTSCFSRKVKDMKENSNVSIIYPNFKKLCYVCYSGKVEKLPFPESSNYWNSSLIPFYPEGNHEDENSNFTTWRIIPHTISIVDVSSNLISVRKDFRAPELQFNEENQSWIISCDGKEN